MPSPESSNWISPLAIIGLSLYSCSVILPTTGALLLHRRHGVSTTPIAKSKNHHSHAAFVPASTRQGRPSNSSHGKAPARSLFRTSKHNRASSYDGAFPRLRHVALLLAASPDDDEDASRGFEAALAALDALGSLDLDDCARNDDAADDDQKIPPLEYSRTDDTDLANYGKATVEEAELYLDMKGELEGKINLADGEFDKVEEELDHLVELPIDQVVDHGEELPWESINPILRVRGPVASGYGRGGKKLGVPTANLPASLFQSALEDVQTGVYFGWAVIEQRHRQSKLKKGRNTPLKAVVNVGYSPTFEGNENKEKIVEAHLITDASPMDTSGVDADGDDGTIAESSSPSRLDGDVYTGAIEGDFYDETLRLQLIGFLRPEQKFDSFPALIAQIHRDIGTASVALGSMPFVLSKEDEFISGCRGEDGNIWVGSGGGDATASWEFEDW